MIFDIFVFMFSSLLRVVVSILPNAPNPVLPATFTNAFNWVVVSAGEWNNVFPLSTAFSVILFMIGFEIAYWGFKLGVFIYDKIRGSG